MYVNTFPQKHQRNRASTIENSAVNPPHSYTYMHIYSHNRLCDIAHFLLFAIPSFATNSSTNALWVVCFGQTSLILVNEIFITI